MEFITEIAEKHGRSLLFDPSVMAIMESWNEKHTKCCLVDLRTDESSGVTYGMFKGVCCPFANKLNSDVLSEGSVTTLGPSGSADVIGVDGVKYEAIERLVAILQENGVHISSTTIASLMDQPPHLKFLGPYK